jgi:hypothetical protein
MATMQVDIWDFIKFLDSSDESDVRREARVQGSAEKLRHFVLTQQNERRKLQARGAVDSETAWESLKEKRKVRGAWNRGS